jgi:uncharacterized membrane protein
MAETPGYRFTELDACRGIAIIMMIVFHFLFDLSFFSLYPVDVQQGFWRYFGYATASLFVFIAGVAVMVRGGRIPPGTSFIKLYLSFLRRGINLVGVGMGITLATYIFLHGEGYVVFGILHLIGVSTILAPFFFRVGKWGVFPGLFLILIGWTVRLPFGPIWLIWAGVHPAGFFSVDYTPVIPWFGVFLIGMAAGSWLYPVGIRSFHITERIISKIRIPALAGRHSLVIYLVHQPVLIVILGILSGNLRMLTGV